MKARWFVGLCLGAVAAACMPVTQSLPPTADPTLRATPTPVPAPPTEAVVVPANACVPEQIELVDVAQAEVGFVALTIRPAGAGNCLIRLYPDTVIQDSGGMRLVESRAMPGGPEFYSLDRELAFDLAWAVECPRPPLLRPLTAWVAFAPAGNRTRVRLPDSFVPDCVLFSPGMGVGPGFSFGGEGGEGGIGG